MGPGARPGENEGIEWESEDGESPALSNDRQKSEARDQRAGDAAKHVDGVHGAGACRIALRPEVHETRREIPQREAEGADPHRDADEAGGERARRRDARIREDRWERSEESDRK